jgi:hypothetical protein
MRGYWVSDLPVAKVLLAAQTGMYQGHQPRAQRAPAFRVSDFGFEVSVFDFRVLAFVFRISYFVPRVSVFGL